MGARFALLFAGLTLISTAAQAQTNSGAPSDSLIKAAQAEGEVTFYSGMLPNQSARVIAAFSKAYHIKVQTLRLGGSQLRQRFAAEAESGVFGADVFIDGGNPNFFPEGIQKGWFQSVSEAGLPILASGQFPAKFNRGPDAVAQILPWDMAYNKDRVKPADVPKDWPGVLDAKFANQILVPLVNSSDTYSAFWAMIEAKYGAAYLAGMQRQHVRWMDSGLPGSQALGAGEGALYLPATAAQITTLIEKGAPVDIVQFDTTTGVEQQLILVNPAKAKHPNAGKLFANWILSPEGNAIYGSDPGSYSVYDLAHLPKDYQTPDLDMVKRKDELQAKLRAAP